MDIISAFRNLKLSTSNQSTTDQPVTLKKLPHHTRAPYQQLDVFPGEDILKHNFNDLLGVQNSSDSDTPEVESDRERDHTERSSTTPRAQPQDMQREIALQLAYQDEIARHTASNLEATRVVDLQLARSREMNQQHERERQARQSERERERLQLEREQQEARQRAMDRGKFKEKDNLPPFVMNVYQADVKGKRENIRSLVEFYYVNINPSRLDHLVGLINGEDDDYVAVIDKCLDTELGVCKTTVSHMFECVRWILKGKEKKDILSSSSLIVNDDDENPWSSTKIEPDPWSSGFIVGSSSISSSSHPQGFATSSIVPTQDSASTAPIFPLQSVSQQTPIFIAATPAQALPTTVELTSVPAQTITVLPPQTAVHVLAAPVQPASPVVQPVPIVLVQPEPTPLVQPAPSPLPILSAPAQPVSAPLVQTAPAPLQQEPAPSIVDPPLSSVSARSSHIPIKSDSERPPGYSVGSISSISRGAASSSSARSWSPSGPLVTQKTFVNRRGEELPTHMFTNSSSIRLATPPELRPDQQALAGDLYFVKSPDMSASYTTAQVWIYVIENNAASWQEITDVYGSQMIVHPREEERFLSRHADGKPGWVLASTMKSSEPLTMRRAGPSRPRIVICKCKSYCTTLNPRTGLYEGDGHPQSRSTRDNHARDDQMLTISSTTTVTSTTTSTIAPIITSAPDQDTNWIQHAHNEIEILMTFPLSSPDRPFVFIHPPEENGAFIWPNDDDILYPNHGPYALSDHRSNRPFLRVAYRLHELVSLASHYANQAPGSSSSLMDSLRQKMGQLTRLKEVEWSQQRGNRGVDVPFVNTETHFQPFGPINHAERVSTIISLVMENIFFTPRRALRTLLAGCRSLLRGNGATDEQIKSIPKDPTSGPHRARLNPTTRQFVVCPTCHNLYPLLPGDNPRNETNPFISLCKRRRTPESPECDTPLWKEQAIGNGETYLTPIRKYLHQDLKSWVGRLLSRKGMEELLDSQHIERPSPSGPIHDIWSSDVFAGLKDASGNAFYPGPVEEGRLVFSLSVDSFNPFHMKTAKQSVSSTGIWMVLLNLPQHLRYLHENMYVAGVIPGPDKPSKEDIYPYVELVMKDLLEFWFTGVRFSRTERNILGRLFKAMLVPLICDMLAARQIIGLGSATSHYFCTFCDLDIDDIDVMDRTEWPTKSLEHIRHIACLWRDASSVKEQEIIFDSFGIRWSPLHLLPYWDFVRYTVVDPMHALDLNLFQNHCRTIFQIDTKYPGGDGSSSQIQVNEKRLSTKDHIRSLRRCVELIRVNGPDLTTELVVHPRLVLFTICRDNNILGQGHQIIVGTKWILANNISIWRQRPTYQDVLHTIPSIVGDTEEEDSRGSQPANQPPQSLGVGPDKTLVTRVIRHLLNKEEQEVARGRAFTQGSVAIFVHICSLINIECDDVDLVRRTAKRVLYEKIINQIDDSTESFQELESFVTETSVRLGGSRPVLGKDVMDAVWANMRRTQLPTWVTPAPPNWGTTQRGKLSADNWRVICTIHLPITLIQLWGNNTERKIQILDHFMDLVSAVRIANMRVSSPNQIQAYNRYMDRYIRNIKILYPDQTLKPTHHAALHIGDMLGLFGPNHSHSGPHYERYINFLHRVNTNSKIGQLESTMLNTSARSANIRAILTDDEPLRTSVLELISVMDNVDLEDIRGFRLASILDPDAPTFTPRSRVEDGVLQRLHHQLLCDRLDRGMDIDDMPKEVKFMKEISRNGVCYGTSTTSTFKDSSVIFHNHNSLGNLINAGITTHIFEYRHPNDGQQHKEIFFIVQVLEPIEENLDPYRRYAFGGFICKSTNQELVVSISQIKSHFALTRLIDDQFNGLIHVLPVDRLMLEFDHTGENAGQE